MLLSSFMMIIFYRIYYISQNKNFAMVSDNQSSYVLDIENRRGYIYDRNCKPLVNQTDEFVASIIPSPETLTEISDKIDPQQKDEILNKIKEKKPFLIKVNDYNIYHDGIEVVNVKQRYDQNQLAPHIIGYLNSSGEGVCGIEKAYDEFLKKYTNKIKIKYKTNVLNNNFDQSLPTIDYGDKDNRYGVVLTIDKTIQQITEKAALPISKGAVVVMDAQNGDLISIVSKPQYDINNVSAYLKDIDGPLLNRAFCAYNVGSTYKLLVSCAALEEDYDKFINFKSNCVGYKEIGTNVFKCHFLPGHGTINMTKALEISCNPYFINLALEIGPMNIIRLSKNLGFGSPDVLAKDITTHQGTLPAKSTLTTKPDIANLGFGQGQLTATPIHIAKMIAMIANDGYLVAPRLVKGLSDKTGNFVEEEEIHMAQSKIISTKTARAVKNMMVCVVENGSGKNAKPKNGGAGGKTASAQTGQHHQDDPNKEVVHAWFAGFFPVDTPKYVIVVLAEGGESGSDVAAPIFKEIADKINKISQHKTNNFETKKHCKLK